MEVMSMEIVNKKIEDIIPYINNPRKISDEAVSKVASSIKNFGFKNPIIIDKKNEIITGHNRILAAKKLGLSEVPCIVADDLTDAQIKAFRIADNRVAEESKWDFELLKIELDDMECHNFELDDLGFDSDELKNIMSDVEAIDIDEENAMGETQICSCPKCGFEFEV